MRNSNANRLEFAEMWQYFAKKRKAVKADNTEVPAHVEARGATFETAAMSPGVEVAEDAELARFWIMSRRGKLSLGLAT